MQYIQKAFLGWLPLGIAILGLTGFSYTAVQQMYRSSLNDPQVQITEDVALLLEKGVTPEQIINQSTPVIEADKSLNTFLAIYDKDGKPLVSSATIDGAFPKPPVGVFESAQKNGENRVSWQPNEKTRIALVIRPVHTTAGLFVVAGRNMREVETRIQNLGYLAALATLFTLAVSFFIKVSLVRNNWS